MDQAIANEQNLANINAVSQLTEVHSQDWASSALSNLVERYGCLAGYPDATFQGDQTLSRYEFASSLNACLTNISQQLTVGIPPADLATIQRLQKDFATELATLENRVDNLAARVAELTANQFSTTTVLSTSVVIAASDLTGDTADSNPDTSIDSNLALNYRARMNFTTSFTGTDRLLVRLQASNRVPNFSGVSATNMTRLSYEVGNTDNSLNLNLLEYRFPVGDRLNVYLYGNAASHHYYTTVVNPYFASFGGTKGSPSRFSERNPIYRIGDISVGGIAAAYRFNEALRLDLGYLAQNASLANPGAGLFDGTYSALAQLSVRPTANVELGLTYIRNYSADGNLAHRTGSTFANIPFGTGVALTSNSYGLQALWRIAPQVAVSGWLGYTQANRVDGVDDTADIFNYAINIAFPDLFKTGAVGGLGFGMPPKVTNNTIVTREDTATGLHFEAFYEYPITENITVIPGIIYLTNPEHNATNGNIFVGTVRTVFGF
nr:iron uptake porin [Gloeocapsopsis dulcis]